MKRHLHYVLSTLVVGTVFGFAPQVMAQDTEVDQLKQRLSELEKRLQAVEGGDADAAPEQPADEQPADDLAPADDASGDVPAEEVKPEEDPDEGKFVFDLPGDLKLRIWGQARWRGEYREESYAQPKGKKSDFVGQRLRLGFDLDLNENLGVRVAVQDVRLWGDRLDGLAGARLASDPAEIHLYEGYGELRNPGEIPLTIRVGRMRVPQLGDQRLVSNLDWSNISRSWDGVQVTYEPEGWWIMGFAHNMAESNGIPGKSLNDDLWFTGLYASNRMVEDLEVDLFLYWRHLGDNDIFFDHTGDGGVRDDYTLGARIKGKAGMLGYGGFIAYQYGDHAGDIISAWAAALTLSATLDLGDDMKFKILTEYAFASGDPDPTDSRFETFDPLLPFAHAFNGHQDLFAWANLHSIALKLAFWPMKKLSLHLDTHFFFLDRRDDAWYGIGFARTDPGGRARNWDSSYVGAEIDVYAKFKVFDHLSVWTGYSHFIEGPYVRATGSKSSDQDWAFLMVSLDF